MQEDGTSAQPMSRQHIHEMAAPFLQPEALMVTDWVSPLVVLLVQVRQLVQEKHWSSAAGGWVGGWVVAVDGGSHTLPALPASPATPLCTQALQAAQSAMLLSLAAAASADCVPFSAQSRWYCTLHSYSTAPSLTDAEKLPQACASTGLRHSRVGACSSGEEG